MFMNAYEHDMKYLSDREHPWQGFQRCVLPWYRTVFPVVWICLSPIPRSPQKKLLPVASAHSPQGRLQCTHFSSKPGNTRKIYWKKIMRNHGLHNRWIDYSSPFTLHIHFSITIRCYLICFDIILFNGLNFYERLIASKWFCLPYTFLAFVIA